MTPRFWKKVGELVIVALAVVATVVVSAKWRVLKVMLRRPGWLAMLPT
jgi:hypothetical protein